jgi:hypothetical protein
MASISSAMIASMRCRASPLTCGREALVTARVETDGGQLTALLEVAIAPTPLTSDESIA